MPASPTRGIGERGEGLLAFDLTTAVRIIVHQRTLHLVSQRVE
jgi:hypothetical protein